MSATASLWKISSYIDVLSLAASVAETITKPSGYSVAIVTPEQDLWCRRGGTAAVPGADISDGTGSFLIGAGQSRVCDFNDPVSGSAVATLASLSVISGSPCLVSIEWFK